MNNLLIPEPPLQVLPSLAKKLKSVDKAIMLQQIFYWQQKSTHVHDGYKWVYNTVKDWHKQFPWLSEKTVQRYLKDLEDKGFLITGNYNKANFDRTKWYRVNQIALDNLSSREGLRIPTKGTESSFEKGTDSPNQYHRIPETTSETTIKRNIKESSEQLSAGTSSDHIPYSEVIDYLNEKAGTNYRTSSQKTRKLIRARFNEKFTLEDFKQVIDTKTSQWIDDPKMDKYLRPETLFGTKFENYLNEKPKKEPMSNVDWTDVW